MSKARTIISGFDPHGPFGILLFPRAYSKRIRETRFRQEWILTRFQYACLRMGWNGEGDPKAWLKQKLRNFKGPKFQRGNFAMFPAGTTGVASDPGGPPAGNVVLTNQSFEDPGAPVTTGCAASFENDGELWERLDIAVDSQVAGEWWDNEPVAGVGDFFEVRALSSGKSGTWSSQAASDDVWITISATRQWKVIKAAPNGTKSTTATFEVGPDGVESADDSAVITCVAEYNDL